MSKRKILPGHYESLRNHSGGHRSHERHRQQPFWPAQAPKVISFPIPASSSSEHSTLPSTSGKAVADSLTPAQSRKVMLLEVLEKYGHDEKAMDAIDSMVRAINAPLLIKESWYRPELKSPEDIIREEENPGICKILTDIRNGNLFDIHAFDMRQFLNEERYPFSGIAGKFGKGTPLTLPVAESLWHDFTNSNGYNCDPDLIGSPKEYIRQYDFMHSRLGDPHTFIGDLREEVATFTEPQRRLSVRVANWIHEHLKI